MTTDRKLDMLIEAVSNLQQNMVTKEDAKALMTKEDAKAFLTKDDLNDSLVKFESSLLEKIHMVQEKANNHFSKLEKQLGEVESTIQTNIVENSIVNLLLDKVADMQKRLDKLEGKAS